MPFMRGIAPVRYTLKYLESGSLHFKDLVRVVSFNFNDHGSRHEGLRNFIFWHINQLQYINPSVQLVALKNMTPTPFIRFDLADETHFHMDVDGKTKEEIHSWMSRIICKSQKKLEEENQKTHSFENPAYFGFGCERHCICELPGQCPCPAIVEMPKVLRGKYRTQKYEDPS